MSSFLISSILNFYKSELVKKIRASDLIFFLYVRKEVPIIKNYILSIIELPIESYIMLRIMSYSIHILLSNLIWQL
jgi:hypothetical protein